MKRIAQLSLVSSLVVAAAAIAVVTALGQGWRLDPRNWFLHPLQRLLVSVPAKMPELPVITPAKPLVDPSITFLLHETVMRQALDGAISPGYEVIFDPKGDLIPHQEYIRFEKVHGFNFTDSGTIRLDLAARVLFSSWFRANVLVERLEVHLIPTVGKQEERFVIHMRPIVTNFKLAPFGAPPGTAEALDRLLAHALTTHFASGIDQNINPTMLQFNVELPKYHTRTIRINEIQVTLGKGALLISGKI